MSERQVLTFSIVKSFDIYGTLSILSNIDTNNHIVDISEKVKNEAKEIRETIGSKK